MKPRPTLYILDAYSLIYQVFHAIPLMTGPAGQPTQAVFGIFRDLVNLLRDRKPDYLAAAFDGAGRVFRSELYAEYKAQRAAMPDELIPQIPVIRRVFEGFRVPVLMQEGVEADDVIATVVLLVLLTGFDRLVLGVHFPTDVLAGWLVGTLVVVSSWVAFGPILRERALRGAERAVEDPEPRSSR